jgi:hypothetical protein
VITFAITIQTAPNVATGRFPRPANEAADDMLVNQ